MKKISFADSCTLAESTDIHELLISDKVFVGYNVEEETLFVHWEGEIDSDEIKNVYNFIIDKVQDLNPRKWLLDLHKRDAIKRKDQQWVFKEVFPALLRQINNDVFVAVVLPVTLIHGLVGELDGDELIDNNNFLIIQHFLYREEAQRWLNKMHGFQLGMNNQAG